LTPAQQQQPNGDTREEERGRERKREEEIDNLNLNLIHRHLFDVLVTEQLNPKTTLSD
jgi:hypothetical protein